MSPEFPRSLAPGQFTAAQAYALLPAYGGVEPVRKSGICSIRAGVGRSLVASVTCACARSQRGANGSTGRLTNRILSSGFSLLVPEQIGGHLDGAEA